MDLWRFALKAGTSFIFTEGTVSFHKIVVLNLFGKFYIDTFAISYPILKTADYVL